MKHHDHAIKQYGPEGLNSSVPPPIDYENYKLLINYFIHKWAVPGDSHLLLGGLDYAKLIFYEYLSALMYKYMFEIIPKKYMELNETKA